MRRPLIPLLAATLLGLLLTTAPVGVLPAGAAVADRVTLVGLTPDDKLVTFTTDGPGTIATTVAVTGLATGEHLIDVAFRPATATLYGVGTTSRLYSINRTTGAATAIGTGTFAPALSGTFFGMEFNPTVDRIRVVSDTGQNLRLNPDTGTVAATDIALGYAPGDSATGTPKVTAAAYTNGFTGATLTALYAIDTQVDALVLQNPPNGGVLNTVGPLGIDAGDVNGFDIDVTPTGQVGLAALTVGGSTRLYSIDLKTGKATEQAPIGDGTINIKGLSVAPPVGYWLATDNGTVVGYGDADPLGSPANLTLSKPIVGMAASPSGEGYWLVATDGGIFNYGDARFFGSTGAIKLNKPIVGIAPYPDGNGYWMVASDGGIFSFAADGTTAKFFGSAGNIPNLAKPIVGMAPTPTGNGYWLVASDGGIFSYGDAKFLGSTGAIKLNQPIVGMARYPDGKGYWMVASDGGIFSFAAEGTPARYHGSAGNVPLAKPIVGMAATHTGAGYWIAASDGGIFNYGDAVQVGSAATRNSPSPFVGIAAP